MLSCLSRNVVQARDIFELQLVLSHSDSRSFRSKVDESELARAKEHVLSVDYKTFRSRIISLLSPDVQAKYASRDVWETLVLKVVETLNSLIE